MWAVFDYVVYDESSYKVFTIKIKNLQNKQYQEESLQISFKMDINEE